MLFVWHMTCLLRGMIEALYDREAYQMAQVLMDKGVLKHQAIASNIANIETPGYKRVELDKSFEHQLQGMLKSGDTKGLSSFEHKLSVDKDSPATRPDGNNVQLENEMLSMNRNALEYEFLTKYMSRSFGKINTAISGRVSGS